MSTPPNPQSTMAAAQNLAKPLTLIVATTKSHGIGLKGQLPWPQIKSEMAYFARVTKRPPPTPTQPTNDTTAPSTPPVRNAVIMGRKTWDSIPPRFRPLKGRLNCIVSRTLPSTPPASAPQSSDDSARKDVLFVQSIPEALHALGVEEEEEAAAAAAPRTHERADLGPIGHVFVIGGSSIYAAALQLRQARRVLLTRICEPEFECDAFFPVDLEGGEAWAAGWRRMGVERLQEVTGEVFGEEGAVRRDGTVEFEFCLYER